ncbi:MAG: hypothetical protein COA47_16100 [Robiginitomaculum sp.]|nr:MAG: hypothetical protein COA47_16100 [Robiginitomaculum sp.]
MKSDTDIHTLSDQARACTLCATHLPMGPRPVFQVSNRSKILIAGQAPGRKVHETGIPFDDPSGKRLRRWLGVDRDTFYNPDNFAILPMGFCFPGTGKSGDNPPRPECAPQWREDFLGAMPEQKLRLIIGQYAIGWHLPQVRKQTLTQTIVDWRSFWPELLVMPHPSPRNIGWFKANPWFEQDIIPELQKQVKAIFAPPQDLE